MSKFHGPKCQEMRFPAFQNFPGEHAARPPRNDGLKPIVWVLRTHNRLVFPNFRLLKNLYTTLDYNLYVIVFVRFTGGARWKQDTRQRITNIRKTKLPDELEQKKKKTNKNKVMLNEEDVRGVLVIRNVLGVWWLEVKSGRLRVNDVDDCVEVFDGSKWWMQEETEQ